MTAKPRKPLLVNLTWAAALLPVLLILYVASVGPACWLTARSVGSGWLSPAELPSPAMRVYCPLGKLASDMESQTGEWLRWWMTLGVKDGDSALMPTGLSSNQLLIIER